MILALFLTFFASVQALYGSSSDVIIGTEANFKDEVLKYPGIAIVEFFAPWCGHCKSLAPEYEKAATLLKGVVKIVAVDATVSQSLGQKYGVQGYPTLKVFGADKKSPTDYQGQRTTDAIVSEAMKSANQLVKDRKKGKSGGGNSEKASSKPNPGSNSGSKKASDVIELTDDNFQALVMDSNDHWLVEFYAPWCGHCKNLAPEWETAAKELKGSVKLGAVDATVHTSLASKYEIKGFPTIKIFSAGPKSRPVDYNGPRESSGIVQHALKTLDESANAVPPKITQITSPAVFDEVCGQAGKICAIAFVPHIYDSSAKDRKSFLDTVSEVAKGFRGKPLTFGWSEASAQEELEKVLDINSAYPSIVVVSLDKKRYAVQKVSWNLKNIKAFVNGVLSGSERKSALSVIPTIASVSVWDGKDAAPPAEEPLDPDFLN